MKRYQQQMLLPEIGETGQEKLINAKVLLVGAGGLGTVVATYLAAMGIGTIRIVDFDEIEETNLHRQFHYTPNEIGQKKSTVLAQKVRAQNSYIQVNAITEKITKDTIDNLTENCSIVCDCTDNISARVLLDKYCHSKQIPLVHGAVSDWQGYVTLFHSKNKYRYSDLIEIEELIRAQTCQDNGISSPICGIIGSIMANETLKIILNTHSTLDGRLLYIDSLKNVFKTFTIKKSPFSSV
ncbi:MAG: HesA/MoeB/ThiF family protein [Flavobacterium sp.]|jgi:molybdopterin/thiamine biosynthesis adenylyltransferase|uniref:HesA/MoeB/ThiF family protein n=1 Tax=Flavobacterium sp. TaxID=239 RepID=UPI003BA590FB